MARTLCIMVAFTCLTPAHAQDRIEFMVITVHGQERKWMLPTDWEPMFKDGYLVLSAEGRTKLSEVAALRPKRREPPPAHHEVELLFPSVTGKRVTRSFWVPDAYVNVTDAPLQDGLYRIDAQTFVRAGCFTELPRNP